MQVYLVFAHLLNKMCISHIFLIRHRICQTSILCALFFFVVLHIILCNSGRYGEEKYGNHSMKSCLCIFLITIFFYLLYFPNCMERQTNEIVSRVDFCRIHSNTYCAILSSLFSCYRHTALMLSPEMTMINNCLIMQSHILVIFFSFFW